MLMNKVEHGFMTTMVFQIKSEMYSNERYQNFMAHV